MLPLRVSVDVRVMVMNVYSTLQDWSLTNGWLGVISRILVGGAEFNSQQIEYGII